jgi:hypothetical protein
MGRPSIRSVGRSGAGTALRVVSPQSPAQGKSLADPSRGTAADIGLRGF